jgi:hypothetical protein
VRVHAQAGDAAQRSQNGTDSVYGGSAHRKTDSQSSAGEATTLGASPTGSGTNSPMPAVLAQWRRASARLLMSHHSHERNTLKLRPNMSATNLAGATAAAPHERGTSSAGGAQVVTPAFPARLALADEGSTHSSARAGALAAKSMRPSVSYNELLRLSARGAAPDANGSATTRSAVSLTPQRQSSSGPQQLRLYAEALFSAGMNDLKHLQELVKQVRTPACAMHAC